MPSLAALHECPCAVAQLYNTYYNGLRGRGRGAITMQDESTLDNDGGVLAIIADLASLSATRRGACTHHAVQCHHYMHVDSM